MRFWTMLLRYTPDEIQAYLNALLSLFEAVDTETFRRADMPHGTLLQIDTTLLSARSGPRPQAMPLPGNVAYTGWMRDPGSDRLFSACRDDVVTHTHCLQSLIGEFSLATLRIDAAVAATDHYATQPVYYHRGPDNRLIVASDLRLLLVAPQVGVRLCEDACLHFLSRTLMIDENEPPEGMTFFLGVKKLPPSGVLTVDYRTGKAVVTVRDNSIGHSNIMPRSQGDYIDAFRETFDQCVRDRLAAGASALLLSGGIDSSTVLGACLASSYPTPVSITMGFKDPDLVMSQDDKLVTALFAERNLPHTMLYADSLLRLPTEGDLPVWVDGPDASANPLVKQAYAHLLRESGQRGMIMTGEGGDAMLGESMHEWIVDAIRANHGVRAAHRYITNHLGYKPLSRVYFRRMLSSICPLFAHRDWYQRAHAVERHDTTPPYLRLTQSDNIHGPASSQPRDLPRFKFVGHYATYEMLFPRASYFDSLSGLCVHSHPFLDPRMIAFSLSIPPHVHHDYQRLNRRNAYSASKQLARAAYREQLPAFVFGKTHKTSYALMARRMFHNSAAALYRMTEEPMLLHQRGLVDQPSFRRHLLAYIVATEDPNANLGTHYHFIRGVTDLERWLRQFSCPRDQFTKNIAIRPLCPVV